VTEILLLSASDVEELLDPATAIASQLAAFRALGDGDARLAPRLLLEYGPDGSVAFCYAARSGGATGPVCKFGSVTPGNARRGLPTVSAVVVALDPATGQPVAVINGTSLTTLRTSAATAVAAQHLAAPTAAHLSVFGCGVQGAAHVRALAQVLPLARVLLWAPRTERRAAMAAALSAELGVDVAPAGSPEAAVRSADVVVTCTSSSEPVFAGEWLRPGSTVLSVGSFAPDRCETDQVLLRRAGTVVVDDVPTAAEQAGPIVQGLREGRLDRADLVPLGDVVSGRRPGRRRPEDVVYYNSVGIGVQDAAAAWAIVSAAKAKGYGRAATL